MSENHDLTKTFHHLQESSPDLVAGTTPIGMGEGGLVIDHHDGTVTKLLFRKSLLHQAWADSCLHNELAFLNMMGGSALHDVRIPEIVADVTHFEEGTFFASYRMTKLSGTPAKWQNGLKQAPDRHFIEAGSMMACFHEAAALLPFKGVVLAPPFINMDPDTPEKDNLEGKINPIPFLDKARNDALEMANNYLQTHKQAGILHGDLHGKNILLDKNGRISGLLDFAFTGRYQNILHDFAYVPFEKEAAFIKGYAETSGKPIDPMMMTLTRVCCLEKTINQYAGFYADFPDIQKKWFRAMDTLLMQLRPITRYTPY